MPRNYEYKEVAVQELLLDEENPRFASSILVKESTNKVKVFGCNQVGTKNQ